MRWVTLKILFNNVGTKNVDTREHQKQWLKDHPECWQNNLRKGSKSSSFKEGDGVKPVYVVELDKSFNSLKECSQWLLENGYTKASSWEYVRKSLSRCLTGERKSYLGMHFRYI